MEIFLQKGGVIMKRNVVSCLMLGAFMLVLTGMPLQLLHIDFVKSSYAYIAHGENHDWDRILGQENDSHYIRDRGTDGDKGGWHENQGQGNEGDDGVSYNILDILDRDKEGNHGVLHYISEGDNDGDHGGRHNIWGWDNDGDNGGRHKNGGYDDDGDNGEDNHHHHGGRCNKKVPEPGTLSLLGAGIAGVGVYSFIRRRNHK
jgi:hypothetical protein